MRAATNRANEPVPEDLSCLPAVKRRRRAAAIAAAGLPRLGAPPPPPRPPARNQSGAGSAAAAGSGGGGEPYTQWHICIRSLPLPSTRTFAFDLADDDPSGIVSLGRSRIQSNLVVDSKYAQTSRLHCTFRVSGKGNKSALLVDDSSSLNGLYVNERRVRSARLRTGDTLILGTVEDSVGVGERLDRRKLTSAKTSIFEVVSVRSIQRPAFRTSAGLPPGGRRTRVAATITDDGPLGLDLVAQGDSMVVAKVRSGAVKSLPFPRIAPGWVLESVSSMAATPLAVRTRQTQQDVQVLASPLNNWARRLEQMPRPLHLVLSRLAFDVLGRLPLEIVSVVLDGLRVSDLCKLAQCSRRCRFFVDRDRIWRPRCLEVWSGKIAVEKPPASSREGGEPRGEAASTAVTPVTSASRPGRRRAPSAADVGVRLRSRKTLAERRADAETRADAASACKSRASSAPSAVTGASPAAAAAAAADTGAAAACAALAAGNASGGCWWKEAYHKSLVDSRRVEFRDASELCGLSFFFRFKSGAGHFWTDRDPSWNGGSPVTRQFNENGTIDVPEDDAINTDPDMSAFL